MLGNTKPYSNYYDNVFLLIGIRPLTFNYVEFPNKIEIHIEGYLLRRLTSIGGEDIIVLLICQMLKKGINILEKKFHIHNLG